MRFDVGVFVDVGHLLTVEPTARRPNSVMRRIDAATKLYCLSGAISHRIVVADCADTAARGLAEDFAITEGFRIRHVPASGQTDCPQVLHAEVSEVAEASQELLVVVVVGGVAAYSALADPLHRRGRAIIALTADTTVPTGAIDAVVQLPLDPAGLRQLLRAAAASLAADGMQYTSPEVLLSAVSRHQNGFRPEQYGFRKGRDLVRAMDGSGYAVDRAGTSVVLAGADRTAASDPSAAPTRVVAKGPQSWLNELAAAACQSLPQVTSADTENLVAGMRTVLDTLASHPELSNRAKTEGLTIQTVTAAFTATCPSYDRKAIKPLLLGQQASAGTAWTIAREVKKPEHIRFFLGDVKDPSFQQA